MSVVIDSKKLGSGPKKILMVGWHSCVRLVKESLALIKSGHSVSLITHMLPHCWNIFDDVSCYFNNDQLIKKLKKVKDEYDIFHVHNEPNAIVLATIENVKRTVIFDAHDYNLLRVPGCREDEILAVLYSDGIINVSQGIDAHIRETYNLDKMGIPTEVIYSWCSEDWLVKDEGHERKAIVYEGGYRSPENMSFFTYRNITSLVYHLIKQGYEFHLYGKVVPQTKEIYEQLGAITHNALDYKDLLLELGKYKWGFSGFVNEPFKTHIQYCMTNKLFEYINAGTPVLTFGTEEQNAFVKEYEIGVAIDKIQDAKKQIEAADWDKLHKNVLERRKEFVMEKQVEKIIGLYEKADKYNQSCKRPDLDLKIEEVATMDDRLKKVEGGG